MGDLRRPSLMYLKAGLFLFVGACASTLILLECPTFKVGVLLALAVWAFARTYYFAFYVIEHYIDPSFRYAGLGSFLRYLVSRQGSSGEVVGPGSPRKQNGRR
ncbi:MAG TPA: hypothetical protein VFT74_09235 [Isosphaeraceae bacterium]|nr:hypothetical protein [Isosphaeraceae bacterium]